ncbi:CBM96 family carbohydrate-binding protein [Dactylosporangium sp. CA-233914]|uniref:CBM96 family carbohydrate-binding protein n=1 Tax=Dactylosporangium sp. CA-233914 TaxID=3239934 RepID=UPI003D8A073E
MSRPLTGRTRRAVVAIALPVVGIAAAAVVLTGSPAAAASTTFTATADTYVQQNTPSTNYGGASQVVVDNSPVRRVFVRFSVSGLSGAVTSAKLRLHTISSNNGSSNGGTYRLMSNTTWSESAATWNNQPAIDGVTVGSLGSVAKGTWYEIDVTSVVTGNGAFSFGGTSSNNDGAYFDSRETGANGPQLVITTNAPSPSPSVTSPSPSPSPTGGGDPVFVGAGDIANSGTGDSATAALLDNIPGTVYTLGDNVYDSGTTTEFNTYYDPTWGRHKARTKPAPGNHDYNTSGATGYYGYFGAAAGDPAKGYYSYDLGNWHIITINSEIAHTAGSAQEQWLVADLAASTKPCTLALWHKPRFTSGANHAPDTSFDAMWRDLYNANADVVLGGHNHQYERFAPQNPSGQLDTARGIREFVAGMGGAGHYGFGTIQPNSEVRNGDTYGVLKLTLHSNSYDWQFVPEAGKTFTDSGTGTCH